MTIRAFAAKYSVPYHIAYKASFGVKPIASMERDRDYNESELWYEVNRYTKKRLREIKGLYQQYIDTLKNLKEIE